MRILKLSLVILSLTTLFACYRASRQVGQNASSSGSAGIAKQQGDSNTVAVSLKQADQSQVFGEAMNRKIIQDADLTMEVDSPVESQRRVTSIAEAHGGFVVTSESKQRQSEDPSQRVIDVSVVIRVPSTQFSATRDEILGLSKNVPEQKTTGQDVTEEYIDLEARIKTQVALEAQFMEIMKQANKVADALEVQRQIAEVRTEIEKLEGRKRFLENRSSLSTITVNLKAPTTVFVNPTGFGLEIKEAAKESVSIARSIILFLIQFVIVMIPILVLVVLPLGLIARFLLRRAKRLRPMTPLPPPAAAPAPPA